MNSKEMVNEEGFKSQDKSTKLNPQKLERNNTKLRKSDDSDNDVSRNNEWLHACYLATTNKQNRLALFIDYVVLKK